MKRAGDAPAISLIIPAYNEEKYLGACLDAVLQHAPDAFAEILVVDNASTDRTAEIASAYPGVRVVREERKGLPHVRQRGYLESRGDVLAYIDADTRMPPGWAGFVAAQFARDPHLACLSGPYRYYDMGALGSFLVRVWYILAVPAYWAFGYMATGGNLAIRRSVLDAMGGIDTESTAFYGEDTAIARAASAHGRVRFTRRMVMPTSARRFREHGFLRVGYDYLANFLAVALSGRAATRAYEDIR